MWKLTFIIALILPAVLSTTKDNGGTKGSIWAVLVAGTNGYYNYRHQADVCHAYQILHRHGVLDSNIIVMMYDDIAYNPLNPKKGFIRNQPGAHNVYVKVPKDYTGENLTAENFLHVLTGNEEGLIGRGSGKVLKSGPNDHVFIYYTGQGSKGVVRFPKQKWLYSDDLINALKTMKNKKMYNKLLFNMEACRSGSMFEKILPKNWNIIATTAANPTECSFTAYYDKQMKNFLGDAYSVAYMEDIDYNDLKRTFEKETLLTQFKAIVKRRIRSHPQIYGDMSIQKDYLKDYIGSFTSTKRTLDLVDESEQTQTPFQDSVISEDVPIYVLQNMIQIADNVQEKQSLETQLSEMIQGRNLIDALFRSIVFRVTNQVDSDVTAVENDHQPLTLETMPCYKTAVEAFEENCVSYENTYAMVYLYKLANLCVEGYSTSEILQAFTAECDEHHRNLTGIY